MNILRKITSAAVFAMMLMSCIGTAFAEGSGNLAYTAEKRVCVYGTLEQFNDDTLVSVMMVDKNSDLDNLSDSEVKYVDITAVDNSGNYKVDFHYSGDTSDYMIYVNADGKNVGDTVKEASQINELITANLDISQSSDGTRIDTSVIANIKNIFGLTGSNYTLALGFYDNTNKLLGISFEDKTLMGSDETSAFTAITPENTTRVKAFIWSSIKDMLPIAPAKELKRQYAVDTIYNENGFAVDSTGDLNIMFVGDSLTAGDSTYEIDADNNLPETHWTKVVSNYFAGKLPGRNVHMYNAGIGGTASDFSMYVLYNQIMEKNPDIVFIENVNDNNQSDANIGMWFENMIRRLTAMEKQPVIILFKPNVVSTASDTETAVTDNANSYNKNALKQKVKSDIAERYNIESIDQATYFKELTKDYTDAELLYSYYNKGNVHPKVSGYNLMGTFIADTIDSEPSKYLKRHNGLISPVNSNFSDGLPIDSNFVLTAPSSSKITYKGFTAYTSYTETLNGAYNIQSLKFKYPFAGVAQSITGGDSFEFKTSSNKVMILYANPNEKYRCNSVKVYVDGILTVSGGKPNPYANNFGVITVPLDGKEHTVKAVTDEPESYTVQETGIDTMCDIFNLLYIVEVK